MSGRSSWVPRGPGKAIMKVPSFLLTGALCEALKGQNWLTVLPKPPAFLLRNCSENSNFEIPVTCLCMSETWIELQWTHSYHFCKSLFNKHYESLQWSVLLHTPPLFSLTKKTDVAVSHAFSFIGGGYSQIFHAAGTLLLLVTRLLAMAEAVDWCCNCAFWQHKNLWTSRDAFFSLMVVIICCGPSILFLTP